ncbi:hypothetical protein JOC34_003371 [Virgibacillus halotolerans]|uniref:hypothetical protein n=1 Tax=Virgibacillus halotolerans TaxID=1071053 RepID=UPI001961CAFE|nr:hypothetical protein [Virgibacillus halotolerans]MBM7600950.1 hypothetical protein [Virgibacillus halotolerans]
MYEQKQIESIKKLLQNNLGFCRIDFQKEDTDDLYYVTPDSKNVKTRIRVKPQLGTVFILEHGNWRQIKNIKIE